MSEYPSIVKEPEIVKVAVIVAPNPLVPLLYDIVPEVIPDSLFKSCVVPTWVAFFIFKPEAKLSTYCLFAASFELIGFPKLVIKLFDIFKLSPNVLFVKVWESETPTIFDIVPWAIEDDICVSIWACVLTPIFCKLLWSISVWNITKSLFSHLLNVLLYCNIFLSDNILIFVSVRLEMVVWWGFDVLDMWASIWEWVLTPILSKLLWSIFVKVFNVASIVLFVKVWISDIPTILDNVPWAIEDDICVSIWAWVLVPTFCNKLWSNFELNKFNEIFFHKELVIS